MKNYIVTLFFYEENKYETMVFTGKSSILEVGKELTETYATKGRYFVITFIYCENKING